MRREGWWALLLLGIGGLAAADRIVASYWDFPAAAGELPDAVRAYRAAGLPWTAADIAPKPVPESENAAADLRAAIAALPKGKALSEFSDHRIYGEPIGSLAPFEPALRLAHRAAAKPKLDFKRDWDLGPNLLFPELAGVKNLCQLLSARAEIEAKEGDDAAALADLEDARRLGVLIGSEPVVISTSVGAKCAGFTLASAQACLAVAHNDSSRLTRYRLWLAVGARLPDLVLALKGEMYLRVANVRNFDRMGIGQGVWPQSDYSPFEEATTDYAGGEHGNLPTPIVRRDGLPENTRSRAYMTRCLQMWTELADVTQGLSAPLEAITHQAGIVEERYEHARGLSHGYDSILFPVFSDFLSTNHKTQAEAAVTLAFADALILHARTGRWPTSLTTPDPLGGGPLKVRFDGTRFRVWSVGRNGKDEKGLLPREKKEGETSPDDIVAAYPPVPLFPRTSPPPPYVPGAAD